MNKRAILLLILFAPFSAMAQEVKKDDVIVPPLEIIIAEPEAPYDVKMLRLSEVLGSIHYLRDLCGASEGVQWRDVMSKLIAAERPGPKRKARLIARFNRGYSAFNATYGNCTASALLASKRYMKEGAALSAHIVGRYGR